MSIDYNDVKHLAKIEIATGRAAIPCYESEDDDKFRKPDMNDMFGDVWAITDLYRRMRVIEAMNTIIRYANNIEIADGEWLYLVEDSVKGLEYASYTNDEDFFEICKLFKEIVSESDLDDLVW